MAADRTMEGISYSSIDNYKSHCWKPDFDQQQMQLALIGVEFILR